MQAQRFVTRVTDRQLTLKLPSHFNDRQVEVIVLALEDEASIPARRRPHPDIVGTLIFKGNIFDSAPAEDWETPI